MSHGFQVDPSEPTIIGNPLHPVAHRDTLLVEGKLGNPVLLNDDDLFVPGEASLGGEFYLLMAGEKGHSAREVAQNLRDLYQISIRPFVPGGQPPDPNQSTFEIDIDPERSYHYLAPEVQGSLRFRPKLEHLRALYGERADFFEISCRLPNNREAIFGRNFRVVRDTQGQPTGENINTRKFDLIQSSIDGVVKVIHRGGLAIFDRQDLDGKPDNLYLGTLSDLHIAKRNDEFENRAILLKDGSITLKINNANANFNEAIKPRLNAMYRQGRLDLIITVGDDVDFDGLNHEASERISNSNNYYLAKFMDGLEPPIFTTLGNHQVLPEEHPPTMSSGNFNLTKKEVERLEDRRYSGLFYLIKDGTRSIMNDPNALISYYDILNPFHDTVIHFGRGDPKNPDSKDALMIRLDMGGADFAHFRQDDPIYRDLQTWPFQLPFLHPLTIMDAITHTSPHLRGPTREQLTWLGSEVSQNSHIMIVAHPSLLNSQDHQEAFDPKREITALVPVGENEELTYDTTAHGDQMRDIIARSPNVRLYIGGHGHFDGNAYVIGRDYQDNVQIYRGPVRELLARLSAKDQEAIHHFWFPGEDCKKCPPGVATLFGKNIGGLRDHKVTWQVGSAGMGGKTVFSILTLNPEGLISGEEHFYINKVLQRDPEDPSRFVIRREVSGRSLPNDRLIDEWEAIQRANPGARLDREEARGRIEARLSQDDASFLPHPDSLNDYPRYQQIIEHPLISPTKLDSHLRLRLMGDLRPDFGNAPPLALGAVGISAEYLFSQDQIGGILRAIILEGLEIGWFRDGGGRHHLYSAWRSPTLIDWKISRHFILRGVGLAVGPGASFEGTGGVRPYLHQHFNLFEATGHWDDGFELFAGLDRHGIFSDKADWWLVGGVRLKAPDF